MTCVYTDCRNEFLAAIVKVFGSTEIFLDMLESDTYSEGFDTIISDDENYIIDRETGKYINWYKLTHIGRDIHSTCDPCYFEFFLRKFKGVK